MAMPAGGANKVIPIAFLALFALGFIIHFSVPWMVFGGESIDTKTLWQNKYADEFAKPAGMDSPIGWALSGLIVGTSLALIWVVAAFATPARFVTPQRQAAAAALMAIPLYLLAVGGASGYGQGMQRTESPVLFGFSIAGTILMAFALVGAGLLALFVIRNASARVPGLLAAATVVAAALNFAVPWIVVNSGGDTAPTTALYRDAFSIGTTDPLEMLGIALLLMAIGSTLWALVSGLMPQNRWAPLVNSTFALLMLVPTVFAVIPIGRLFGGSMSAMFDGTPAFGFGIGAYLFAIVLGVFVFFLGRTLVRGFDDMGVPA